MKQFKELIPNIFILTEGETEKIYLNHLKQRGHNYSLHIQSYGRNDPLKMVKRCNEIFRNRGMSVRRGDYAFCVVPDVIIWRAILSSTVSLGPMSGCFSTLWRD